ncbi:MAG: hypothetical protein ABOK23_10480 [Candidatus Methanoperedens sp.]|nr:hypothetical protein [Candidatus Methanoperedens sp.]
MNIATLEDLERLERLEIVISELQTLADSGAIIVVEGLRDAESLRFLGIKGEIKFAARQPCLNSQNCCPKAEKRLFY